MAKSCGCVRIKKAKFYEKGVGEPKFCKCDFFKLGDDGLLKMEWQRDSGCLWKRRKNYYLNKNMINISLINVPTPHFLCPLVFLLRNGGKVDWDPVFIGQIEWLFLLVFLQQEMRCSNGFIGQIEWVHHEEMRCSVFECCIRFKLCIQILYCLYSKFLLRIK